MIATNHGLQAKDELSEKSEVTSIQSDNPARIEDIFEWIDGIPLSKTTKNLARDFSDAVLMSEILKFYYPNLVNSHNYVPANSVNNKKENWNTLNRKVFSKINMHLSPELIDQLVHSQFGAIEKVLIDFRDKQMTVNVKEAAVSRSDLNDVGNEYLKSQQEKGQPKEKTIFVKAYEALKYYFVTLSGVLLTIICFWNWFSKISNIESVQLQPRTSEELEEQERRDDENVNRLRDSYAQALDDLRAKADVIKTLCHKVAFLEGTMKLKDMKIATLAGQLEMMPQQPSADGLLHTSNSSRPNLSNMSPLKLRRRPRTQV